MQTDHVELNDNEIEDVAGGAAPYGEQTKPWAYGEQVRPW